MPDYTLKLNSVTNLSDARYAASYGFAYISFCFDESSVNYISPQLAREIYSWIAGPKACVELAQISVESFNEIRSHIAFDIVESAYDESLDLAIAHGQQVILNAENYNWLKLTRPHIENIAGLVLGDDLEWNAFVAQLCEKNTDLIPMVHFSQAERFPNARVWMLDCGNEEKPGFRDFEAFDALLERLDMLD